MKKILIIFFIAELLLLPVSAFADSNIKDEFAEQNLKKIKSTNSEQAILPITDDFAEKTLKNSIKKSTVSKDKIVDNFAEINLKNKKSNVKINTNYDYTSLDRTILEISPLKTISTKRKYSEGMEVTFLTKNDIKINSTNIPKGTEVIGRIETISPSSIRGVPAELIIDNFYLKSNPDIYFAGTIDKTGASRYFWIYPAATILTSVFGVGALLWLIKGGHAKIRKNQTFKIFYSEN